MVTLYTQCPMWTELQNRRHSVVWKEVLTLMGTVNRLSASLCSPISASLTLDPLGISRYVFNASACSPQSDTLPSITCDRLMLGVPLLRLEWNAVLPSSISTVKEAMSAGVEALSAFASAIEDSHLSFLASQLQEWYCDDALPSLDSLVRKTCWAYLVPSAVSRWQEALGSAVEGIEAGIHDLGLGRGSDDFYSLLDWLTEIPYALGCCAGNLSSTYGPSLTNRPAKPLDDSSLCLGGLAYAA